VFYSIQTDVANFVSVNEMQILARNGNCHTGLDVGLGIIMWPWPLKILAFNCPRNIFMSLALALRKKYRLLN